MELTPPRTDRQPSTLERRRLRRSIDDPMRHLCDPALRSMMIGIAIRNGARPEEAADIAQTVLCRLVAGGASELLADPDQLWRYVATAARNGATDLHRSASARRNVSLRWLTADDELVDVEPVDERDALGAAEIALAARGCIGELGAMERLVLDDLLEGRPVAETAASLGRSEGDVRRTRSILRRWLAEL